MDNNERYKKELDGVAAGEGFKQRTLRLLLDTAEKERLTAPAEAFTETGGAAKAPTGEKQGPAEAEAAGTPAAQRDLPRPWYIVYRRQILAAACVALVAGVGLFSLRGYDSTGNSIPVDVQAPAEQRMEAAPEAAAGAADEGAMEPDGSAEPKDAPLAQSTLPSRYFIGPLALAGQESQYSTITPDDASLPPNGETGFAGGDDGLPDAPQDKETALAEKGDTSVPPPPGKETGNKEAGGLEDNSPPTGGEEPATGQDSTAEAPEGEQDAEPAPIEVPELYFGAMGFEGHILEDIDEQGGLMLGEEEIPETLPVFANNAQRNDFINSTPDEQTEEVLSNSYLNDDALTVIAEDVANALGLGQASAVRSVSHDAQLATDYVEAEYEYGSVWAYADGSAMVWMDPAAVPGLSLEPAQDCTAEEQEAWALEAVEYFSDLFYGMRDPYAETTLSRTFTGEPVWTVTIHDAGNGDETEFIVNRSLAGAIVSYSFDTVVLHLQNYDTSAPLGDYPTITAEEATALLNKGKAFTTVPYEYPGEEAIAGIDLVYRANGYEDYFIPYYRFWVELPEDENSPMVEGLKNYGIWYVPAIEGEYISFTGEAMYYFN